MITSIKFTIKFNNLTFGLPMYCFILFTINLELASIVGGVPWAIIILTMIRH